MRRAIAVALLLALVLSLVGCLAASPKDRAAGPEQAQKSAVRTEMAAPAGGTDAVAVRKTVQTASMTAETPSLAQTEPALMAAVGRFDGRVESSRVTAGARGQQEGRYTIRVPQDRLAGLVTALSAIENLQVREKSLSSQDVTEEFIDIDARLTNLRSQEQRLRDLMTRAATVEEILKVQNELTRVRSQIDSLDGRMRHLTGRIELATLTLALHEPKQVWAGFGGRIGAALREALEFAGESFIFVLAACIGLTPAGLLAYGAWRLWRAVRQRKAGADPGGSPGSPPGPST